MKTSSTKIKEEQQLELYAMFEDKSITTNAFKQQCIKLVEEARAPNNQLLRQLPAMSRDRALMSVNNFIMKGQGYGVN
mgnify:CR=1 FL=1